MSRNFLLQARNTCAREHRSAILISIQVDDCRLVYSLPSGANMGKSAFTLIELLVVTISNRQPAMRRLLCFITILTALIRPVNARADEILVSAAASLTDAFNEIGKAYTGANPGTIVRFNFGASGALQQQILQGAPVDVF